jgi:RNA polymerase sigma factor (sigma-70 family)
MWCETRSRDLFSPVGKAWACVMNDLPGRSDGPVRNGASTANADKRLADLALTQAAGEGDAAARRKLAERLFGRTHTTVVYLVWTPADRDDCVQDALIEILNSAPSFRGESSLETWADRITVRTTLRMVKRQRRRAQVVTTLSDGSYDGSRTANGQSEDLFVRHRLAQVMRGLSEERRTVVVLRLVHGYSVNEIAEMTGTPVNTVRDRLQSGRRDLHKRLLRDPFLRAWGARWEP